MKQHESDYLNKLFATSSDMSDEVEVDIPLVDTPERLSKKLHAIADNGVNQISATRRWPKFTSVAAGLFVAVIVLQFYQQHQTMKQLEQAQADLATALHYLGEANRITREQVLESLNNDGGANVLPAMKQDDRTNIEGVNIDDQQHSL